jgi:hypothetical protein
VGARVGVGVRGEGGAAGRGCGAAAAPQIRGRPAGRRLVPLFMPGQLATARVLRLSLNLGPRSPSTPLSVVFED